MLEKVLQSLPTPTWNIIYLIASVSKGSQHPHVNVQALQIELYIPGPTCGQEKWVVIAISLQVNYSCGYLTE